MEFSVLNKQTIQCVMTEAEIADYGMDKLAIYRNDERAVDFFKQIMRRAERETGFVKHGRSIAVHAAFLSDESLEITFSTGPDGVQTVQNECRKELSQKAQQAETIVSEMETAVFKSRNLEYLMEFCRRTPVETQASVYRYRGSYFLLADVRSCGVRETAVLFCLADEYVDEICYTKSIAVFIREHGQCMIPKDAVGILASI